MIKKQIINGTEKVYPLYISRDEVWICGNMKNIMKAECYNHIGDWIGNLSTAQYLCDKKGIAPEKNDKSHCVCSIGFSQKENKWYGWSHRAICGFTIGDKLYTEGLKKSQMKTIENMDEAKQAAINFSNSVS